METTSGRCDNASVLNLARGQHVCDGLAAEVGCVDDVFLLA